MSMLDRKLRRDLWRLKTQGLAIALVMAAGIAVLILAVGTHRSLFEIRETYYERNRFADVFAEVKRAPRRLVDEIRDIPGVATVEARVAGRIILDIEGLATPASGRIVSLPLHRAGDGQPLLNRLYLREGRLPVAGTRDEVAINEAFAKAHGFRPGMRFGAIIEGRRRTVTVVGIVLSPEFIYASGPGEIMPDDKRFGVIWMAEEEAEAVFDMQGAFNSVTLTLRRGAQLQAVIDRLDRLLAPFGGFGAYGRKDQQSHAFLDSELVQLQAMSWVMPPVFLIVAAFLINMTLSRIIALERGEIGLLKAVGYTPAAIGLHYVKLVLGITAVGLVIGLPLGYYFGWATTRMYTEFYHFPYLIFINALDVNLLGVAVSVGSAILGAVGAVRQAVQLPPAVAMSPPAPTRYRRLFGGRFIAYLPQTTIMILRHMIRFPLRTALTSLGIAGGVALLLGSLSVLDSVDFMIDITYFRTLNYATSVEFIGLRQRAIVDEVAHLPGVLAVEPHRSVAVTLRHGQHQKRLAITGIPVESRLRRLLDPSLAPLKLPDSGLAIAEKVAEILHLARGDVVRVEVMEGRKQYLDLPVTAIMQGYLGLSIYMSLDQLNALMGDGIAVSGVALAIDERHEDELYSRLKDLPAVGGMSLLRNSLIQFRKTLAENLTTMILIYTAMAMVITFGVVYNASRINLSERSRELASLRVLGFTRAEVSYILLGELALQVLIAIPPGWLMGVGLKWAINQSLDNDLFRVPFYMKADKFFYAAAVSIIAATISALIVRRRVDQLDLIEVLKTRE
jgi:putative ABC transport system permease protein